MKTFFIKNMGCKSNQLEGAIIRENLINFGYEEAENENSADFFILNSCTVTHKSDKEVLYILKHIKNNNPQVQNVLTGCFAQIEKDNLMKNPYVDILIGNDEKLEMAKYLENPEISDIMEKKVFHKVLLNDTKKTRASLKIQDGCDNRCSYCIIPFARGRNRSADVDFILNQIKLFENSQFKEIVLTGIHIGQWGMDFEDKKNLLYLLKEIEEKTNIQRFRLGSLNPLEIDDEMLSFLKSSEKFCPHFHLSLQSLCNKTLKNMNRHYCENQILDLIEKISNSFKLPFIGSDVIAGFVGENDDDFNVTVSNLKKSKLTQIHTFPYSIRKGTIAEKMHGHLSDNVKKQRAEIIKKISAEKLSDFHKKNRNKEHEILIEKLPDKKTKFLKAMTRNYIEAIVPLKDETLKNTLQNARLYEKDNRMYAEII